MAFTFTKKEFEVNSPNLTYSEDFITSKYSYERSVCNKNADGSFSVEPKTETYTFRTRRKVPRCGTMLVGWGGNNGCTMTAGIIANTTAN